jgi:hypothetical protein
MIKCLDCKLPKLTWADQRGQFGRAIRHGLTADEAKALMPRCQKCLTMVLKHWKRSLKSDGTAAAAGDAASAAGQ